MSIFQQLIKSIYSPPTVAKFRFQGIGKTILYVFVLMLITFSVSAYQFGSTLSNIVLDFQDALENDIPDFELNNGMLTSDLEEPFYLEVEDGVFILDTTGNLKVRDVEEQYVNGVALLEREAVFITDGVAETFRYRELGNVSMTKSQIEDLAKTVVDLLPLIIAIVIFILYSLFTALKFIGIFFLSIFGIIFKRNGNLQLSYKQIWILSAYAITLPTVFFAITDALFIQIPWAFSLYWFVAVIMLYLIFKEIPVAKVVEDEENLDKY